MNIGFEQNGKNETFERPVLIIKQFNLEIMWIIPMTSQDKTNNKKYYFPVKYKNETSYLILSQLRLISSKRLLRKVRTISKEEFNEVRKKIKDFL
ncbi:MAG: type II toxin-antitoxin system PemK/MazF family toxin [Patescibacteria group bacterium]